MKVRRILNKEENKYYFVIIYENDSKTIQADYEKELEFHLNSGTINEIEYHACIKELYKGSVEVYYGNI